MDLKFNPRDWEEIHNYLKDWDNWRRNKKVGRPDYTSDSIFSIPLTIALMKSQEKIERLTKILIFLTIVLALIGVIQLIQMVL